MKSKSLLKDPTSRNFQHGPAKRVMATILLESTCQATVLDKEDNFAILRIDEGEAIGCLAQIFTNELPGANEREKRGYLRSLANDTALTVKLIAKSHDGRKLTLQASLRH